MTNFVVHNNESITKVKDIAEKTERYFNYFSLVWFLVFKNIEGIR